MTVGAGPGGRAGVLADSGYLFDTGPTVLTIPERATTGHVGRGAPVA